MKKCKRKFSGMTLVEMIISLAVFAALALVLAAMGRNIEQNRREANKLNRTVAVNGPVAEAQNNQRSFLADDEYVIRVANNAQITTDENGEWTDKSYVAIKATLCYVNPTDSDGEVVTNEVKEAEGTSVVVKDPDLDPGDFVFKYLVVPKQQPTDPPANATPNP
jgi:prepilin-type N-terminal cleavage/methylation domain-containing protein